MAKPSEELVVEVEVGIADPPFIAIPRGQVLSPMSVGRRGMWRIEGNGVLDVHGYVYFDGKRFFLQTVDERSPVIAHGQPIGRAWTSVSPPCKIEMGSARLHFRATYTESPDLDDQETAIVDRPQVRVERPFKPGEFSHRPESESTRVQPLEGSAPASVRGGNVPPPPPPPPPPGMSGPPVEEIPTPAQLVRPPMFDVTERMVPPPPTRAELRIEEELRETKRQPGLVPHTRAGAGAPPNRAAPSMSADATQPAAFRMAHAGGVGAPNPQLELVKQKWDELSGPKKILVALLPALMVSLYFLFIADDEPPPRVTTSMVGADAGAPMPSVALVPNAGLASVPSVVVPPTVSLSQLPIAPPPPTTTAPSPTGSALPTTTNAAQRSLERQAVDFVANGQYERAAAAYDQLAQLYPDRPAYREAARILRGKLDAGQ